MASYQGHLSVSCALGAIYGSVGVWYWNLDWGPVCLGAGMTALGGVLPDLDSDSGIPIRELFSLAAAAAPFLLYRRIMGADLANPEQILVILGCIYLFIRYGLSSIFKRLTVHRGMFHSIPAMFIAGLIVFLLYGSPDYHVRTYLAVGTMFGFLSHLILDEIWAVDFNGLTLKLNKFAGSALKLYSSSWPATLTCYSILAGLIFLFLVDGGWEAGHLLELNNQ